MTRVFETLQPALLIFKGFWKFGERLRQMLIPILLVDRPLNLLVAIRSLILEVIFGHHADGEKVKKEGLVGEVVYEGGHSVHTSVEQQESYVLCALAQILGSIFQKDAQVVFYCRLECQCNIFAYLVGGLLVVNSDGVDGVEACHKLDHFFADCLPSGCFLVAGLTECKSQVGKVHVQQVGGQDSGGEVELLDAVLGYPFQQSLLHSQHFEEAFVGEAGEQDVDPPVLGGLLATKHGKIGYQGIYVGLGRGHEVEGVLVEFLPVDFQPLDEEDFHGHKLSDGEDIGQQECGH